MKVLFDNVLDDALISSDYESANYPASNIADEFFTRRYQKTSDSVDTITCQLDGVAPVDCFFIGYSNAPKVIVRFYNSDGTLENTETILGNQDTRITTSGAVRVTTGGDIRVTQDPLGEGSYSVHFDQVYVYRIEIDVYGTTGAYVGGAGAGKAEEMEQVLASWSEPFIDNTVVTASPAGQSTREYIEPYMADEWTMRAYTRERINELRAIYRRLGLGAKVWVDLTEDNHDFREPYFARIASPIEPVKNSRYYDFTWNFQEAR